MIQAADNALKELILDSLSVSRRTVDIKFDLPSKDWASRLNRPTINLFLFDIRENLRLRGAEQQMTTFLENGSIEVKRNARRIDLRYLLTAWTKEPEDEHMLLSDALLSLLRNDTLPEKYLTEKLRVRDFPVLLNAAVFQPEHGPTEKVTDIWGVVGNSIHAGYIVTLTITVDPYKPEIYPAVRSVSQNVGQTEPGSKTLQPDTDKEQTYTSAFVIRTDKYDSSTLDVRLCERNQIFPLNKEYQVSLPPLPEGKYHLDVRNNGKVLKHQAVSIPADQFEVVL